MSIIPVIGGMISSSLRGFDSAPLGLQPIVKGTQAIMAIKKGIEDDDMEDSFEPIAEAISYAFGAPSDFGINLVENLKIMNEENEYNMAGFIYSDYAYKKYFKD